MALLLLSVAVIPFANSYTIKPLYAGKDIFVGNLHVYNDDEDIVVYFDVVSNWEIKETHLYVGDTPPDHSAPGQLGQDNYGGDDHITPVDGLLNLYILSLNKLFGGDIPEVIYIAAHATVQNISGDSPEADLTEICFTDEDTIDFKAFAPGQYAYFDSLINDQIIKPAWCVDPLTPMDGTGTVLFEDAPVVSTYDPAATSLINLPDNLDNLNYLLNNKDGYPIGDVQQAIWELVYGDTTDLEDLLYQYDYDTGEFNNGTDAYDRDNVDALVNDALANGDDFVPGCGQVYGIIIDGLGLDAQRLLVPCDVICDGKGKEETAWADAKDGIRINQRKNGGRNGNGGGNWATYFEYYPTN